MSKAQPSHNAAPKRTEHEGSETLKAQNTNAQKVRRTKRTERTERTERNERTTHKRNSRKTHQRATLRSQLTSELEKLTEDDKKGLRTDVSKLQVLIRVLAAGYGQLEAAQGWDELAKRQAENTELKAVVKVFVYDMISAKNDLKSKTKTMSSNLANISKQARKSDEATAAAAGRREPKVQPASAAGRRSRPLSGAIFAFAECSANLIKEFTEAEFKKIPSPVDALVCSAALPVAVLASRACGACLCLQTQMSQTTVGSSSGTCSAGQLRWMPPS